MSREHMKQGGFDNSNMKNDCPSLRRKVLQELHVQGIAVPSACLRLEVDMQDETSIHLDTRDTHQAFQQFGEVTDLWTEGQTVFVRFRSITSAYFAQKLLNNRYLAGAGVTLRVFWHTLKQNLKFNCKFPVEVEDPEFPVAKRIIGPKGSHIKSIIEACCNQPNAHEVIKVRLRGRGSGYKEGAFNTESNEPLHICVSSRFADKYRIATNMVETLLDRVHREFAQFCKDKGKPVPPFVVQKLESRSGINTDSIEVVLGQFEAMEQLSPEDINQLISIRNDARKKSQFSQADSIRNLLRRKGVQLIDGKGARGRAQDVTNWKYLNS